MPRWQIPVYAAEREAGLADAVRSHATLAFAAAAEPAGPAQVSLSRRALARLGGRVRATNEGQPDLHYLKTVLVTTGWNNNDDVFDRLETWAARHSPEDKPFNYEHAGDDIIGHITANFVLGADDKVVSDDTVADELPAKFHVVTAAVLYKAWEDEKLQERMDGIIAELAQGKWFVSMEAHFAGFDYALAGKASGSGAATARVVARGEKTAFLTKHLRAYGGSGLYQGQRVGRLLRGIVFAGKGLVRRPANPESVVLSEGESFDAKAAEILRSVPELGYGTVTAGEQERDEMAADNEMTAKVEELKGKNKALKEENERLAASLKEVDSLKVKATEEGLKAEVKARDEKVAALTAEVASLGEKFKASEAESQSLKAKLAETEKSAASAREELEKTKTDRKRADRVAAVKSAYGCDDAKAGELADTLAALSDESFKAHADYMAEKLKGADAGKQTPAKDPPQATDKPAPMGGAPKKVKTLGSERDGNAGHADPAVIANAEPNKDAALNGGVTDDGVEKTRASIKSYMAGWFGLEADEAGEK